MSVFFSEFRQKLNGSVKLCLKALSFFIQEKYAKIKNILLVVLIKT